MTRQDVVVLVAILTTCADAQRTPAGGIPSGHLYAALMSTTDLNHYHAVLSTLKSAGFIEERGHFLRATERGIALAKELEEELEGSRVV